MGIICKGPILKWIDQIDTTEGFTRDRGDHVAVGNTTWRPKEHHTDVGRVDNKIVTDGCSLRCTGDSIPPASAV